MSRWVLHFNGKSQLSPDERHILAISPNRRSAHRNKPRGARQGLSWPKHVAIDYSNEELYAIRFRVEPI